MHLTLKGHPLNGHPGLLFSMQGVTGIAQRLDVFCRDAENRNIPIIEAYRHVTLVLNYSDPQIIAADRVR